MKQSLKLKNKTKPSVHRLESKLDLTKKGFREMENRSEEIIQHAAKRDLEKGLATHSSTLAWRISMDSGAWWAVVHGVSKSWT